MLTTYLFRYTSECTVSQSNFRNFLRSWTDADLYEIESHGDDGESEHDVDSVDDEDDRVALGDGARRRGTVAFHCRRRMTSC